MGFISKERVDENIKFGFAKAGDYKEVQVPLNTIVVGGYFPEDSVSKQEDQTTSPPQKAQSSKSEQSTPVASSNSVLSSNTSQEKGSETGTKEPSTIAMSHKNAVQAQQIPTSSDEEWAARGSGKMDRSAYQAAPAYTSTKSDAASTKEKVTSDYTTHSNPCGKTVYVHGYYRKDGTYVAPYYRRPPGCG